jgi:hypothetical protein
VAARRAFFAACGLCAAAVWIASAAAAALQPLTLMPGDQVDVKGTSIHCAVSTRKPTTIVCGLGAQTPERGSYVVALADSSGLLFKVSRLGTARVLADKSEPHVRGAVFASPGHRGVKTFVLSAGEALSIANTHVSCAVTPVAGHTGLACGLYSAGGAAYANGSTAALMSARLAALVKIGRSGAEHATARATQP